MNSPLKPLALALLAAGAFTPPAGLAETLAPQVVITATRVEQNSFDVPASIDSISAARIRAGNLQVDLSESMGSVPGLQARNRQNYAQDLQISSRGFGARATFGVRGIRLYTDGIPATMPDGQGQVSHFALGSAQRIEVLRGPFSALYGNSSGGVIQIFTEDGAEPELTPSLAVGSYETRRYGLKASGSQGKLSYVLEGSQFSTRGYREHSDAERTSGNAKLKLRLDDDTQLTLLANSLRVKAADPLGLTQDEFRANPQQATAVAKQFDTRKDIDQMQGGLALERRVNARNKLALTAWSGSRSVRQVQSIPVATQAPATHPGGVIDFDRRYAGMDGRWIWNSSALTLTGGLSYETSLDFRRGYRNYLGSGASQQLGVLGAQRRDEHNTVSAFDQYIQAEWRFAPRWSLSAGVRHSTIRFVSEDNYVVTGNPDDSGNTRFSKTTPVLGLLFRATDSVNLYASAGVGFETPTLNELSYRPNGQSGLNFSLKPAVSRNVEMGAKAALGTGTLLNVALFQVGTEDEIVTQTNSGGRSTFQNAGHTTRRGLEIGLESQLGAGFTLTGAYSRLTATYDDSFLTCTAAPCATPNVMIAAGNRIPGIPKQSLFAELAWRHVPSGFSTAIEVQRVDRVYANDQNSVWADGYTVANLRAGFSHKLGAWRFSEFVRVNNVADRSYAGSVIVNEGNQRYFESAPGRNVLVGASATYRY